MFNQINTSIFNFINHLAGNNIALDKLMIFLAEYSPYVFILVLLYLWFQREEEKNIVLFAAYSATLGIFIDYVIGLFYFHPRPFMDGIGVNLVKHVAESSFPSDHTTFMLSIAILFLFFQFKRKWVMAILALGILGGLARVYTGVHYPFDILGSVLAAFISAYVIFSNQNRLQKLNDFFIKTYFKILKKCYG